MSQTTSDKSTSTMKKDQLALTHTPESNADVTPLQCSRPETSSESVDNDKKRTATSLEAATDTDTQNNAAIEQKSNKKPKKSKIQDIVESADPVEFQAEHLLIQFGNKVISKLLQNGYLQTPLFREIARLATAKGYELNLRKVANDYIYFIPALRALRDIGLDLTYEDDFLLRLAIKWRLTTSVQFLIKNGANPMALSGQPLLDAYMPSSHSKEPDLYILNILLGAVTDLQDVPERLMNKLIKDKDHSLFDAILARTKVDACPSLTTCFKKLADATEPDWNFVSSFIMHQTQLVASFSDLMSSKPSFYKRPDIFGLLLEHNIKLSPTDAMKKHIEAYCQRMLDESNMSTSE